MSFFIINKLIMPVACYNNDATMMMDKLGIYTVRQQLKLKNFYNIPLRGTFYACASSIILEFEIKKFFTTIFIII